MTYRITAPKTTKATINLPASKSISNRALVIKALTKKDSPIHNLSDCDDTEVMVKALTELPHTIDIKAAGTAMRFLTAYLAATPGEHIITGTERMKHRPIATLVDALRYLGADIEYAGEQGFPPLHIKGQTLEGGHLEIPGNISSQYITALLLIAPELKKGLELKLTGEVVSRPYIDLTLSMMQDFGAKAEWTGFDTIMVSPGHYAARDYQIENDWSAASYWYEVMALTDDNDSTTRLTGLMDGSRQGDSMVRHLFRLLGVRSTFDNQSDTDRQPNTKAWHQQSITNVTLEKADSRVSRIDYDFTEIPDLAQTVVVTCALLDIPFRFTGLASLRIKETDRIEALKQELRKLGYVVSDEQDGTLTWEGERCEPSDEPIDTYEDHRMAMAFAPAALKTGAICINNPEVVSKSYPHFWDDLRSAGFNIEEL